MCTTKSALSMSAAPKYISRLQPSLPRRRVPVSCRRRLHPLPPQPSVILGMPPAQRRPGEGDGVQQWTPLMVATSYGNLDMMKLIVAAGPAADVNRSCFADGSTTLHCAASGGSLDAVEAVRMLLAAGAYVTAVDSDGHGPLDVVVLPPKVQSQKLALSKLLAASVDAPDYLWVNLGFMVFRWELPTVENSILASIANDLRRERHPTINPEKVKAAAEGLAHSNPTSFFV